MGSGCECLPLFAACFDAELLTQVVETVPQYFGIEMSWSSALDVGTRPIEGHQKLSVLLIYPVAMRPVPKKANDRWLPIDESPVDVECNSVEIANPKVHNPASPRDDDIGDMFILLVGHATREHRLKLINFQGHQRRLRRLPPQTFTPRAHEMLVILCEALLAVLPHRFTATSFLGSVTECADAGSRVLHTGRGGAVSRAAGVAPVIVAGLDQGPAGMGLAADTGRPFPSATLSMARRITLQITSRQFHLPHP